MFFNQIPQQANPPQVQPQMPQITPPSAVPQQIPQVPGMPPGGMPPGAQPQAQQGGGQSPLQQALLQQIMAHAGAQTSPGGSSGTPGLDLLKLLMMMQQQKRGGAGPMSGGVGSIPPQSLGMPYSLSNSGDSGSLGIYDLIAKAIQSGGTGMPGASGASPNQR
jgi:hypothetical protein